MTKLELFHAENSAPTVHTSVNFYSGVFTDLGTQNASGT